LKGSGIIKMSKTLCEYIKNPTNIDVNKPRFSWQLTSEECVQTQTAYQILVSSNEEDLKNSVGDMWDSGKVKSSQSTNIIYEGKELESDKRYYWKVKVWDKQGKLCSYDFIKENNQDEDFTGSFEIEGISCFETGLYMESDWEGLWITSENIDSAPLFRKEFKLENKIKKANLYICGLGYFEAYLNGEKVGNDVLVPGWTDFDKREMKDLLYPIEDNTTKRILYLKYDVTELLKEGRNALGVILGNGWYNQRERTVEGKLWYENPKLIFQLNVEFEDHSRCSFFSNDRMKTSGSPIVFNNIFYGEVYDARLEKEGWNTADYDDSDWSFAKAAEKPLGKLCAQNCASDRIIQVIQPVKVTSGTERYIYDLGQNLSGWINVKVNGTRGTKIVLKFAEEINEDGLLDYRSAGGEQQLQSDTYILKGEGEECYEPRFTWHGFRYVELTGSPEIPAIIDVEGKFVCADVKSAGSFHCSNKLFNKINELYRFSQLSNFHGGVPSDCPHRERLGYTGDGQATVEAAIYNFDMAQFYTKWLKDIKDSQDKISGHVPHTSPFYGGGGGPAWGCAYVIIPWYMYLCYGDKSILEEHYEGMKAWIEYLKTRTDENNIIVREEEGGWCLGDWCTPEEIKLSEELVNTCYFAYVSELMSKISGVLGDSEQEEYYIYLNKEIKKALNNEFLDKETGNYSTGIQGANVFPLAFGLVPEEYEQAVLNSLFKNINNNNGHLDTGILATPLMLNLLVENGYEEIAYEMLNKTTFPSYGYMIEKGATTLWETWDGGASHNHPMFGSVSAWFYKYIAGIRIDENKPGFENIIIEPYIIGNITSAKASLETVKGFVEVSWEINNQGLTVELNVPVNCKAEFYVPRQYEGWNFTVKHKDIVITQSEGYFKSDREISALKINNQTIFRLGSGRYSILILE
jgi:alpha-L-rhamnosidase